MATRRSTDTFDYKGFEKELEYFDQTEKKVSKPYTQFSKKFVIASLINLVVIEVFAMIMIWRSLDTSQIAYLITGLAAEMLGVGIWYMKNSEAEKKARINAEVERMKAYGKKTVAPFDTSISSDGEPNTYFQGSGLSGSTGLNPINYDDGSVG